MVFRCQLDHFQPGFKGVLNQTHRAIGLRISNSSLCQALGSTFLVSGGRLLPLRGRAPQVLDGILHLPPRAEAIHPGHQRVLPGGVEASMC